MYRHTLLYIILSILIISCGGDNGSPNPEITGIQPTSGPEGTVVTISGSGFDSRASGNEVAFNGTVATLSNATESELVVTVPNGATSGAVSVTVGQATATGPNFTVEPSAPGINSVDPDSGVVGTQVTITGLNFSDTASENDVRFNGTPAAVQSANETELVAVVPQGATDGPIEITVGQESITGPNFDVITDGTLQTITETTGSDLDNNGYQLSLDGGNNSSIGINDTLHFQDLEAGSYQLELTSLAANCSISGSNPRTEDIIAGDTTTVIFTVDCAAITTTQAKIVFESDRDGDREIYMIDPDGNNLQQLTDNTSEDINPIISHDGTKIAFDSDREGSSFQTYIMDVDGSNVRRLVTGLKNSGLSSWSPDDSRLVLQGAETGSGTGSDIYIINADGSNLSLIYSSDEADLGPSWSPDGTKIAFNSYQASGGTRSDIQVMNTDGTEVNVMTSVGDNFSAEWSPDGMRIAFSRKFSGFTDEQNIYTMKADGSDEVKVTEFGDINNYPSWSPDGSQLVYEGGSFSEGIIYKVNADGSGSIMTVFDDGSDNGRPTWGNIQQ